jgi:hypothetical protein
MLYLRSINRFILVSLALLGLSVSSVNATSVSDSDTGLKGPDVLVDFGSNLYNTDTVITDQFSDLNVTFANGPLYKTTGENFPAVAGGHLVGNDAHGNNPFDILFSIDATDALFSFRTSPTGTSTFSAFLDGTLQETLFMAATSADSQTGRFYGFTKILFDKITVSANTGAGNYNLDNLQFNAAPLSPVPVPAAVWLFGTALIGLVGFSKRRKTA